MRKRWDINTSACWVLAAIWFVVGFTLFLATMDQGDPNVQGDGTPQLWAGLLWVGPFALGALGATVYWFWRWLTSENGWIVKRVPEPIHKDLREHNG